MGMYGLAPQGAPFSNATSGVFVPETWSTDVIRYRDANFAAKDLVSTINFAGQKGDTIYLPFISRLAVESKTAGNPVTYQALSERRWSMVVRRYKDVAFAIDKLLEIQANVNLRAEYTREAGYALARDMDNAVLAERATINGFNSSSNVITTNVPLSFADILSAYEILLAQNVPTSDLCLLMSPLQWTSLISDPLLSNKDYTRGGSIESGQPLSPLGISMKMTTNIGKNSTTGYTNGENGVGQPTAGSSLSPYFPTQNPELRTGSTVTPSALTANYHTAILAHKDWCKMAVQKTPSVDYEWSVDYQEHHIVMTQVYDVKCFRPDHAVIINTDEEGLLA
jgi:hypothetical protein